MDINLLRIGALYIPFSRLLSVIYKLVRSGKRHFCVTNKERPDDPSLSDWFKKWRKARGHSKDQSAPDSHYDSYDLSLLSYGLGFHTRPKTIIF